MKTETQCEERLEKLMDQFQKTIGKFEALNGAPADHELQLELTAALSVLIILTWVLDGEELMKPFLTRIKIGAAMTALEKVQ